MMNNHTDESTHDNGGLNLDHCAVVLPPAYVLTKKFVKRTHISFPEHLCEFVSLERGMQQEPVKLCIAFVMFQGGKGKAFENSSVVFSFDCGGDNVAWIEGGIATGFVVENGVVEFFLGGKMAKDHRFGNAGSLRNFPGRRAAKAFLGEEADCDAEDLQAPFLARHAGCPRA